MYVLNVFFERIFNALVHFLLTISYNLQIPTYYKVVVIYHALCRQEWKEWPE